MDLIFLKTDYYNGSLLAYFMLEIEIFFFFTGKRRLKSIVFSKIYLEYFAFYL